MATIDESKDELQIKLVFWGPPSSGKTTNLKFIHKKLNPSQRGDLMSCKVGDNEALFFDFTPLNIGDVYGKTAVFHLYAFHGEIESIQSKKALLKGADGILFVADSSPEALEANGKAMKELRQGLESLGLGPDDLPITLQLNKRDREDAATAEEIKEVLRSADCPSFEATAIEGKGVLDSFTNISKLTLRKVKSAPEPKSEDDAGEPESQETEPDAAAPDKEREEGVTEGISSGETEEKAPPVKVPLDDALSQYAFDEDDTELSNGEEMSEPTKVPEEAISSGEPREEVGVELATEEDASIEVESYGEEIAAYAGQEAAESFEEAGLPEGIEMEPGFEPDEEEGIELATDENASIEVESYGEEIAAYAGQEAAESFEEVGLPEGIEMEPGFEPEGDEGIKHATDDVESIEVESYGDEIAAAGQVAAEAFEEVALPEGIEMEPGFEPEDDEGIELAADDVESIEVESYGDEIAAYAGEEAAESFEEVGLPEGIEMEAGFEPEGNEGIELVANDDESMELESYDEEIAAYATEDAPEGIEIPEEIASDETLELEEGGLTPPAGAVTDIEAAFEADEGQYSVDEPLRPSTGEAAFSETEDKITIGLPENRGDGKFAIPLIIHSAAGRKNYNINLSLSLEPEENGEEGREEAPLYHESSPKIGVQSAGSDDAAILVKPVEPALEATFPDELGEEFSSEEGEPSETWETGVETTVISKKKGFFATLFGKKK